MSYQYPGERRDVGAGIGEGLHLRGHQEPSLPVVAPVERADADGIPRDDRAARLRVPEHEGEDPVQPLEHPGDVALAVEGADDLAVRLGLEVEGPGEAGAELAVVVDLAVHRERHCAVRGDERLRAARGVDDREALVDEDDAVIGVDPAPVGATVALAAGQLDRVAAQGVPIVVGLETEQGEDGAHGDERRVRGSAERGSALHVHVEDPTGRIPRDAQNLIGHFAP